nr:hypothetical protein CFP56_24287 [Quercus suber]
MGPVLISLGFACLILTAYIFLKPKPRDEILSLFHFRRRRDTGSLTPPRSLSPGKQGRPSNEKTNAEWRDTFPPPCRHALAGLKMSGPGPSAEELSKQPPDYTKLASWTETQDAEAISDQVTATGFTMEEIRRLGDFPDYAALSGVPLPQEYQGFDPDKALSRPYRPLRWAYHQTMSMSNCRHALAGLKMSGPGPSAEELSKQPPDYTKLASWTETQDAEAISDQVTATGFTMEEIRRLGDFPDYAALSGVPLPQEYQGFDPDKALSRPYRPLRWAYHQTMCKSHETRNLPRPDF